MSMVKSLLLYCKSVPGCVKGVFLLKVVSSEKKLGFKGLNLISKDCEERRGHMHEMNLMFKQMLPPNFCLKVVCKRWGVLS